MLCSEILSTSLQCHDRKNANDVVFGTTLSQNKNVYTYISISIVGVWGGVFTFGFIFVVQNWKTPTHNK